MFLSNASIRRPIAMSCLIIALALLGLNSYRKLGLELMPKIDVPYITIVTVYPGASPKEIETDVAKRIEDVVVSIDGLKHVTSSCMENVCQTLLEFQLDVDVDLAATDVREKIDLIRDEFPQDVEDPKIVKFDINSKAIVTMALTGDAALDELYDYADNALRDRITVIPGVADADLIGGAEREVQVLLDRDRLAARGLVAMDVVKAVGEGIRTIPSGRVKDNGVEYSVKFDADYEAVADIGELEVANSNGQRVAIRDLGQVRMTTEELRQIAFIDGRPCVIIKVIKKADANAVRVANAVRDAMADMQRNFPGGMELVWVTDDGRFIEATNESAWINVFQGIALTAAILFIFLYNLRSLLVVAITMPLTIVIGLFFMDLAGFTLNTSTLIAIGMSIGILVTNSIVVLEAIVKRLDETGDPRTAARLGGGEAAVAVVASAGTNIVVLFPLSMMDSMVGLFIRPLALTMFIMTAVSLFISFTLTPILCSLLLKPKQADRRTLLNWMESRWNRGFAKCVAAYRAVLEFNERHRAAAICVLLIVLGMFTHSVWLMGKLGSSMVANSDMGEVYVRIEYPTSYDLAQTAAQVKQIDQKLADLPELRHRVSTIGKVEGVIGQSSEGVYLAQMLLRFSDRDKRDLTIDELMDKTRELLADYPGAVLTITVPEIIGGQSSDIEMEIFGHDFATLDKLALKTQSLAAAIPGVLDVDTTVRIGKPELRVLPKRSVLADLHVPATSVGLNLRANLEGLEAGTFKCNARNYDIVVKLEEQQGKRQVEEFLFPGTPGHQILLRNLAQVVEGRAQVQITRKDKQRTARVLTNLVPTLPLGSAVNKINHRVDTEGDFPPGYTYEYAGMYEHMTEGQGGLIEAVLVSVILVVLALAAILESFKQPFLILVTLPLALIGMVWALALTGESLGVFVIMGGVMMVGIVVNNAILIMDQFNVHVREGIPRHKAMITASCERFRPIVMITLAAVLGMMPLAFGRGLGAEMRNGVGIASVGGILISGILTLIVMPILYDLCTRGAKNKPQ